MSGTIDVSDKKTTRRRAVAEAVLQTSPEAVEALRQNRLPKQDPLATARAAAMLAAKQTPSTLPHCHPIAVTDVKLSFELGPDDVAVRCSVSATDRTGPEMEALMGASVAALTLYDMLKGTHPGGVISRTRLLEKSGGRSGHWRAEDKGE